MNKNRLEAISDGIFAIVMTLLILDVRLPNELSNSENFSLWPNLILIKSKIIAFVFSFFIISTCVIGHHFILSLVKKVDGVLLIQNFLLLLIVTFIPFPTSILAEHPENYDSLIFYTVIVIMVGLFHTIMLWRIYKFDNLRIDGISKVSAKKYFNRNLWSTLALLIAIAIGYYNVQFGFLILVIIPIFLSIERILSEKKKHTN